MEKSIELAEWDTREKREIAMCLKDDYPVTTICTVLDLPRSSFYHQGAEPDDSALRLSIQDLAAEYPTYGYRRITVLLQRAGWTVNHKRIRRMMAEMGLQRPQKRRKTRTTNSQHDFGRYPNLVKDLTAAYPEHIWVADITYVRLHRDFVYLAVIMDVFTRAVRGWYLSRSLDRTLTLTACNAHSQIVCPTSTTVTRAGSMLAMITSPYSMPMRFKSVWRRWASQKKTGTPNV